MLETFVTFGAPQAILYEAKPHVGTDILKQVIYTMRLRLEEMGVSQEDFDRLREEMHK